MLNIRPSLDVVFQALSLHKNSSNPPNLVPLCATISGADLTPSAVYKKLSAGYSARHSKQDVALTIYSPQAKLSFLFESVAAAQTIGRHSFVGASE